MSKWSSNKDSQLIFEAWRKFVKEVELPADFSQWDVVKTVDFLNSPEGQDPKVRAALGSGEGDGKPGDERIKVNREGSSPVSKLFPTQNEISLMKSIGFPLSVVGSLENVDSGDITGRGKRIMASGNLVIDGHHRWSSTFAINPNANINTVDIQFPGGKSLNKLSVAQVAIAGTMGAKGANSPIPAATAGSDEQGEKKTTGDNILGASAKNIASMIKKRIGQVGDPKAGPLLGPEYLKEVVNSPVAQKYLGVKPGMDAKTAATVIIDRVANNLSKLPPPQGPRRKYMPQFDGGETHKGQVDADDVVANIETGKINYKVPYKGQK